MVSRHLVSVCRNHRAHFSLSRSMQSSGSSNAAKQSESETNKAVERAAEAVRNARVVVITAGAGMGVDSGLPDFRGPEGFWRAYPPLRKLGLTLPETSTPSWFEKDPAFAWGFFGHRYKLYSSTKPHEGFNILLKWCQSKADYFVFTSNVDGHFQKAGFDDQRVLECHGTIHHLQCVDPSRSTEIWPASAQLSSLQVDENTLRAKLPLPLGPPGVNNQVARPNILMFSDWTWLSDRTDAQDERFDAFLRPLRRSKGKPTPFVVIELGAGHAVPTVRMRSEQLAAMPGGTLIRINPTDYDLPTNDAHKFISLPLKALAALQAIDALVQTENSVNL